MIVELYLQYIPLQKSLQHLLLGIQVNVVAKSALSIEDLRLY